MVVKVGYNWNAWNSRNQEKISSKSYYSIYNTTYYPILLQVKIPTTNGRPPKYLSDPMYIQFSRNSRPTVNVVFKT